MSGLIQEIRLDYQHGRTFPGSVPKRGLRSARQAIRVESSRLIKAFGGELVQLLEVGGKGTAGGQRSAAICLASLARITGAIYTLPYHQGGLAIG